jgi:hypothetical protein
MRVNIFQEYNISDTYLVAEVITVNDADEDVGHVGARVVAFDRRKPELFRLEFPFIRRRDRCSNVMSCDRQERLASLRSP